VKRDSAVAVKNALGRSGSWHEKQSRTKSNHAPNHVNHVFCKTAGRAITRVITAITILAITQTIVPLGHWL
jgi:hypothetical protein